MSTVQYDIYVEDTLNLVRSLLIKNELFALAMNNGVAVKGYPVEHHRKETWKYYLNISGEYHQTDKPMTIKSLDTLEEIAFTKEQLSRHTATRREYRNNRRYYDRLVERYPDQQLLIDGILNPVEIHKAINADDYTVLRYDEQYIESQEVNLIPELNKWLAKYHYRWNNQAYYATDALYPAAQYAQVVMLLPAVISNIRLSNCFTDYAHTHHIRMHLASNGGLDAYLSYLTRRQMLWLYRNVRYLRRHAGKQSTYKTLIRRILTDRGFPLHRWVMQHDTSTVVETLKPTIRYQKEYLNRATNFNITTEIDTRQLLKKSSGLARQNTVVAEAVEPVINEQMETAKQDRLMTKVLESEIVDNTDSHLFTFSDALFHYWIAWGSSGQYSSIIHIENPSNGETLQLSTIDAFIAYLYAYNASTGIRMREIPEIPARAIRRRMPPNPITMMSCIDAVYQPEQHVNNILDGLVSIEGHHVSSDSFYEHVSRLHADLKRHWFYWNRFSNWHERVQVQNAIYTLYETRYCRLSRHETYQTWMNEKGLYLDRISREDAALLAHQLLLKSTGANLKQTQSVAEIHAAMLRLMTQLSSYSVQYVQTVNKNRIMVVDFPTVHPGPSSIASEHHPRIEYQDLRVLHAEQQGATRYNESVTNPIPPYLDTKLKYAFEVPILAPVVDVDKTRDTFQVHLGHQMGVMSTDSHDAYISSIHARRAAFNTALVKRYLKPKS